MCQHPVDLAAVRLIAQQTIQLSRRCAARQSNGEAATRRNRFSGDARNILCCLLANHIDIRINRNIHGYIAPIFLFVCMDSARGFFAALRMTGLRTGSETCHSERSEESSNNPATSRNICSNKESWLKTSNSLCSSSPSLCTAVRLTRRLERISCPSSTEVNTCSVSPARRIVNVARLFSMLLVSRTRQIEPGRISACTCGRIEMLAFPFPALLLGEVSRRVERGDRSIVQEYVPPAVSWWFPVVSAASSQPRRVFNQPASSSARAGLGDTSPCSVRTWAIRGITACSISIAFTPAR